MAQGVFWEKIKMGFPIRERTVPENTPIRIYPKTVHRFWKGVSVWPVVQSGPGILAIKDTEQDYEWENRFFPLICLGMDILESSYGKNPTYIQTSLRYAVALARNNIMNFVNDNFKININNGFSSDGVLNHLSLNH